MMHAIRQAHRRQRRRRAFAPEPLWHAAINQRQFHIGECIRTWQQIEGLKDKTKAPAAEIGQPIMRQRPHIFAHQAVAAACGPIKAADQIEEGGFAGTRWPHGGHKTPRCDGKRYILQRGHHALTGWVMLGEAGSFNQSHHGIRKAALRRKPRRRQRVPDR